jgi:hypothetical protein
MIACWGALFFKQQLNNTIPRYRFRNAAVDNSYTEAGGAGVSPDIPLVLITASS